MGIASLVPMGWNVSLAAAAVAMAIGGGIWTFKRRKLLSQLESQVDSLKTAQDDIVEALRRSLRELMQETGIASAAGSPVSNGHEYRATLACHLSSEKILIPLARHSDNPSLAEFARHAYPDNQGVIGEGWRQGVVKVRDLPEDRVAWNSQLVEDFGFSITETAALSMQSRSLLAIRIDWENANVGILVIESIKARGVTDAINRNVQSSTWFPSIRSLMFALRENVAPQLHAAEAR